MQHPACVHRADAYCGQRQRAARLHHFHTFCADCVKASQNGRRAVVDEHLRDGRIGREMLEGEDAAEAERDFEKQQGKRPRTE